MALERGMCICGWLEYAKDIHSVNNQAREMVDREARCAAIHGDAKSWTRLSD